MLGRWPSGQDCPCHGRNHALSDIKLPEDSSAPAALRWTCLSQYRQAKRAGERGASARISSIHERRDSLIAMGHSSGGFEARLGRRDAY